MKAFIVRLLRRLLLWLDPPPPSIPVVEPELSPLEQRALALTAEVGKLVDVSGEYRRHVVYARLIKEFPTESKRNLGLAIEEALQ